MRARTCPRDDQGSIELAIATPLLLLLVLFVVQTALWAHAGHVAETIAHRALAATRVLDATEASGQAEAELVANQLGGDLLTDLEVKVERTDSTAHVTVQAEVPSLLPGLTWPVRQERSAPVEHFVGAP
ncbi:Flp pilus assembly protein TadG [Nocardiopsis mwathae]|uniref:Flp pilus assembly protein TadG n=1 Tax=Nocardiopsis mwathae TaxID=1472723 RepID=A0A7X0D9D6_9ACTN|nr:TadE/TadG family type IV pilus assembly protein [Nocardiopsis mwathae]MBB6174949.1 Flp pilus assembly protein TadG [Nocardiopsis mwathae]